MVLIYEGDNNSYSRIFIVLKWFDKNFEEVNFFPKYYQDGKKPAALAKLG